MRRLAILSGSVAFCFGFATFAHGWTGPSTSAPNGNASAPLNISSATQTKPTDGNGTSGNAGGIVAGYLAADKFLNLLSLLSAPSVTTDNLYNIGHSLYWNGNPIGSADPVGSVIAYAGTAIQAGDPNHTGYLPADGSAVSRTTYAGLFAVIGVMYGPGDGSTTFNLPDYRGYFLRGVDGGSGNDADAALRTNRGDGVAGNNVGTKQQDAFQGHSYNYNMAINGGITGNANNSGGTFFYSYTTASAGAPVAYSTFGTPRVSTETRPKNIDVLYAIKYASGGGGSSGGGSGGSGTGISGIAVNNAGSYANINFSGAGASVSANTITIPGTAISAGTGISVAGSPGAGYTITNTVSGGAGGTGNVTTTGGSTNYLAKFSGSTAIANSSIQDTGSAISLGAPLTAGYAGYSLYTTGNIVVGNVFNVSDNGIMHGFGGMYELRASDNGCVYANPLVGNCSCPQGYSVGSFLSYVSSSNGTAVTPYLCYMQ